MEPMSVVYVALAFLILVGVHEFGHLLAARSFGFVVTQFAVGFGPNLYQYIGREIRWSLRLIPAGGFVVILDPREHETSIDALKTETAFGSGRYQLLLDRYTESPFGFSPWRSIVCAAGGPAASILFGWVLVFLAVMATGFGVGKPIVAAVTPNSPAAAVGLCAGDILTKLNDEELNHSYSLNLAMQQAEAGAMLAFTRNGVALTTRLNEWSYPFGIQYVSPEWHQRPTPAFGLANEMTTTLFVGTLTALLSPRELVENATGPVGIIGLLPRPFIYEPRTRFVCWLQPCFSIQCRCGTAVDRNTVLTRPCYIASIRASPDFEEQAFALTIISTSQSRAFKRRKSPSVEKASSWPLISSRRIDKAAAFI